MAELVEANADITRLRDMFELHTQEINRLATLQNRPLAVNVEAISDLLIDPFSGIDDNVDCEDFFKKYASWLGIHRAKFPDNHTKLRVFKHCLNGQALV